MDKNFLLGVGITNATKQDILQYIITSLQKKDKPYYITTPNPEFLVHAVSHPAFKTILNNARLGLPDGIGVIWAGKFLGKTFKERVTGVDFMDFLCKEIHEKPITVGFLGGRGGVAERSAECLQGRYPGLKVSFAVDELENLSRKEQKVYGIQYKVYSKNKNSESPYTKYNIPNTDILFVAFGFPKQEEFMASHVGKIPVKVMIGVGGAFDYISGAVPRAPLLIRSIGFEWLFRLLIQPWRITRQLALLEFIKLVIKDKLAVIFYLTIVLLEATG